MRVGTVLFFTASKDNRIRLRRTVNDSELSYQLKISGYQARTTAIHGMNHGESTIMLWVHVGQLFQMALESEEKRVEVDSDLVTNARSRGPDFRVDVKSLHGHRLVLWQPLHLCHSSRYLIGKAALIKSTSLAK